jgi:general secretion pathway protein D
LRAFLQSAGVVFDGTPGASLAYDGSAMIVTQTPRNIERIRNILNRYTDVRQVEIEAKFMEVQEGVLDEMGVTWGVSRTGATRTHPDTGEPLLDRSGRPQATSLQSYTTDRVNRTLSGAFTGSSNGNAIVIDGESVASTAPPRLPGAVALAGEVPGLATISGIIGDFNVSAMVRLLAQKSGSDLLSAPRVTVLSGNTATITVAQELRYPQSYGEIQSQVGSGRTAADGTGGGSAGVTITAGTPQDFTSRNVGVELKVTPTVEEDDYSISLDLAPKVTEFEGFVEFGGPSVAVSGGRTVTVPPGFYQPIFSVREVSTRVTLWDGATLVMGGLTREEVKKVHDKIPVLGDLPLFGRAFRSKGQSSQKRNLLIFVTANLVSPGGSPKKQAVPGVPAGTLFQNPTLVTPARGESRQRRGP